MLTVSPRFDVPQEYMDGLIFRHEDVIRLKVPLVAKPPPKVRLSFILEMLNRKKKIYESLNCFSTQNFTM